MTNLIKLKRQIRDEMYCDFEDEINRVVDQKVNTHLDNILIRHKSTKIRTYDLYDKYKSLEERVGSIDANITNFIKETIKRKDLGIPTTMDRFNNICEFENKYQSKIASLTKRVIKLEKTIAPKHNTLGKTKSVRK